MKGLKKLIFDILDEIYCNKQWHILSFLSNFSEGRPDSHRGFGTRQTFAFAASHLQSLPRRGNSQGRRVKHLRFHLRRKIEVEGEIGAECRSSPQSKLDFLIGQDVGRSFHLKRNLSYKQSAFGRKTRFR